KDGRSPAQALSEINAVQASFPQKAGQTMELRSLLIPVADVFTGKTRASLWLLFGAVGAVLLIVCVNLANLLLAKHAARGRESAIRSALGASTPRLISQSVTESLVLALIGGGAGVMLAWASLRVLVASAPADVFRIREAALDPLVLAFALAASILTGLV